MSDDPTTTNSSIAHSPLWRLPPEMRNLIYEFALYQGDEHGNCPVRKSVGIPEPALLLTCKAVRKEAIGVFYSENRFLAVIRSFDPATLLLLRRKNEILWSRYGCQIHLQVRQFIDGSRRWRNLLSWLKDHHSTRVGRLFLVPGYTVQRFSSREGMFLYSIFMLARVMYGRPWKEVKLILAGIRVGLEALHNAWARD